MALYDMESTKGKYSELAHEYDSCYYCEKEIRDKFSKKEISYDDMIRAVKNLTGKLTNVRVVKITHVGHTFSICPDCLAKIATEVIPAKEKHEETTSGKTDESEIPAEVKTTTKTGKGKKDESK